ncbi:1-deoxy-D-xylulose-5-phosphate synthase [Mycoplasmatota bacterium]|nr:1-deoxy-D-xylulose-5-phosphate synthase [Mycoplasmatota bacterium]
MDLFNINGPEFLKDKSSNELTELSNKIRGFLIESISKTGGHLASNLGIIELTVALHKVFDSPKDQIIFDVGHQCYTHKILTGRAKEFPTLRQFKGLSGFPKRSESPHDVFETGHSSTSISAAVGFVEANRQNNIKQDVIAVIGDGSMTGGLAFEAINHFGQNNQKMIIIINDNEMSISKNVGALSKLFREIRINKQYLFTKSKVPHFVKKLLSNFANTVKYFVDGPNIFESLGYNYYGPVDGHNIKELIRHLELAKNTDKSVIIHVKTDKGKGYEPAQNNKVRWHGVGNYSVKTGEFPNDGVLTWSKLISTAVSKIEDVTVITPAMISGSSLELFEDRNLIDVGIAEGHAATMAAGLAINNKKVFLPFYSTFAQRAYDNILHDIVRQNLHVVIGIDRAGIVPFDGDTHQGIFDISMFNAMVNIKIAMPKDSVEAYMLMDYAFNINTGPMVIRYPKSKVIDKKAVDKIDRPSWKKELTGNNVNIISYGPDVNRLIKIVEKNNISANIYNARFIKPIDHDMVDEILDNGLPTLIYENVVESGSLGQTVISYMSTKSKQINVKLMNIKSIPEHGDVASLLIEHKLDDNSVLEVLRKL